MLRLSYDVRDIWFLASIVVACLALLGTTSTALADSKPPPPKDMPPLPPAPEDSTPTEFTVNSTTDGKSSVSTSAQSSSILGTITTVRGLPQKYSSFKSWITGYAGYISLAASTKLNNKSGKLLSRTAFKTITDRSAKITCNVTLASQSKWKKLDGTAAPTFHAKHCSLN